MSTTNAIIGLGETLAAFDRLGAVGRREASVAVAETTVYVHNNVLKSIQRGSKTGAIYKRTKGQNLSREHQASAPGEAPATDTGNYVKSIRMITNGLCGEVFSRQPLSFWLEYGTKRGLQPRPHYAPAARMGQDYIIQRAEKALERATKDFNK